VAIATSEDRQFGPRDNSFTVLFGGFGRAISALLLLLLNDWLRDDAALGGTELENGSGDATSAWMSKGLRADDTTD
jgi:hypothetical protein